MSNPWKRKPIRQRWRWDLQPVPQMVLGVPGLLGRVQRQAARSCCGGTQRQHVPARGQGLRPLRRLLLRQVPGGSMTFPWNLINRFVCIHCWLMSRHVRDTGWQAILAGWRCSRAAAKRAS